MCIEYLPLMLEKTSRSETQTREIGAELGRRLFPGAVVALRGPLGAGKTTFVKGLARGLEVAGDEVTSPTFVLLQIYRGRLPLYHFDAYRLEDARDLENIGAEEFLWGEGVSVMEWPESVEGMLPGDRIEVFIDPTEDPGSRRLRLAPRGERARKALSGWS